MNIPTAIGLLGYALVIVAAGMVDIKLGVLVAGLACLYIAYANREPTR